MSEHKCNACGFEAQQLTKFCTKCGAPMTDESSAAQDSAPAPVESTSAAPSVSVTIEPHGAQVSSPKSKVTPEAPKTVAGGFGSVTVTITPPAPPPPPPPKMGIRPPASQPAAAGATVTVTTGQAPKSGSNKGVIIGAVALVIVGGVAFMSMGGKNEPQAVKVAESAVSAPASQAQVKEVLSSKDHLNQLLGLARDSRWKEVPAKIALLKSMTQVTKATSAQSKQLTEQGQELLGSDQYDKAAEVFDKAVQADPGNHQARFGLGASLTRLGKFDSALTVLIDGLLIAPDEGRGWLTAAEAFSELGKGEAASSALKLAYYFASNRENAKKFLEDPSRTKSDKFRKVIDTVLPALSGVPAKS